VTIDNPDRTLSSLCLNNSSVTQPENTPMLYVSLTLFLPSSFCRPERRPSSKSRRQPRCPRFSKHMRNEKESNRVLFVSFWMVSASSLTKHQKCLIWMIRIRSIVCLSSLVVGKAGVDFWKSAWTREALGGSILLGRKEINHQ
jgi:hypothetical protein